MMMTVPSTRAANKSTSCCRDRNCLGRQKQLLRLRKFGVNVWRKNMNE